MFCWAGIVLMLPIKVAKKGPFSARGIMTHILALDDQPFIRSAYLSILGRACDINSEQVHLQQMAEGVSRWDILYELRFSEEGQQFDPGIAGLDKSLRRYKRFQLPIAGKFLLFVSNPAHQLLRFRGSSGERKASHRSRTEQDAGRIVNLDQPWSPRASELYEMLQVRFSKASEAE